MSKIVKRILIVVILSILPLISNASQKKRIVKIGLVTDLSGSASYWGTRTKVGAELAQREINSTNSSVQIEMVYGDSSFKAIRARSEAEKMVNLDQVDALFVDFSPTAIAASPIALRSKILFINNSAAVSVLKSNPYAFKAFLDYQAGCKQLAQYWKNIGLKRIGILRMPFEASDLCVLGAKEIYSDLVIEDMNFGEPPNTQLLLMRQKGVEALLVPALEGDAINTLNSMKQVRFNVPFGTQEAGAFSENMIKSQGDKIKSLSFGFPPLSQEFIEKVERHDPASLGQAKEAIAIGYMHIKQLVEAIANCPARDINCQLEKMKASAPASEMSFKKWDDQRFASYEVILKEWDRGVTRVVGSY